MEVIQTGLQLLTQLRFCILEQYEHDTSQQEIRILRSVIAGVGSSAHSFRKQDWVLSGPLALFGFSSVCNFFDSFGIDLNTIH